MRAHARSLKRKKEQAGSEKPAQETRRVRFRRVRATVRSHGAFARISSITPARVILNDFTPRGLKIFTHEALTPGQELSITLEQPVTLFVRARVVWCREVALSNRVITTMPFPWRVGIEFIFTSPEEREQVRNYCLRLFSDFL